MSDREKVIALLDSVPDYKMGYVLAYVQGITAGEERASTIQRAAGARQNVQAENSDN